MHSRGISITEKKRSLLKEKNKERGYWFKREKRQGKAGGRGKKSFGRTAVREEVLASCRKGKEGF